MAVALQNLDAPSLRGWYVGYVIAGVVITLVVILVAVILTMARRIAVQAAVITRALERSRVHTEPLPGVASVNNALVSIVGSAQAARGVLEAKF